MSQQSIPFCTESPLEDYIVTRPKDHEGISSNLSSVTKLSEEKTLSKKKTIVFFDKIFPMKPASTPTHSSFNTFQSKSGTVREIRRERRGSHIGMLSKINFCLNLETKSDYMFAKTDQDLFNFYSFIDRKIVEMNESRHLGLVKPPSKPNFVEDYFVKCLNYFASKLFVIFKDSVQKGTFEAISTENIYKMFELSVEKFSLSTRNDQVAFVVLKNAFDGIIDEFLSKKKNIFSKKSYLKLCNELREAEFKFKGHMFESQRIYYNPSCEVCNKTIWNDGMICHECKTLIHKECKNGLKTYCQIKTVITDTKKFFGVELSHITSFDTPIPPKLIEMIHQIEERGLLVEGIYRKSGNAVSIKETTCVLDSVDNSDLSFLADIGVHVLSNLVKNFFKLQPESMIPSVLNADIQNSSSLDKIEMYRQFWKIFANLSMIKQKIIDFMAIHLAKICSEEASNKMSSNALAIVFVPCFFAHDESNLTQLLSGLSSYTKFVEFLIIFKLLNLNKQDIMLGSSEDIPQEFINDVILKDSDNGK
ncbi:Unconventional myosin-IXa [Thelohanellus kitauei]|uniref:Unconventional myosin-IXa n=1 Tax=Thelohanellus kitauei TaxID=669202 RepID=A0A0C2JK50_THEKT|nr:Unconventional myosin-IXa [Thelohanellus kitauei]